VTILQVTVITSTLAIRQAEKIRYKSKGRERAVRGLCISREL